MVGSIGSFFFQQNYVSKNYQGKHELTDCDTTQQSEGVSKPASFYELVAKPLLPAADTTIKTAVNVMKLQASSSDSANATTKVDNFDINYSSGNLMVLCWTDKYGGSREGYSVAAWVSEDSTPENPQVYVETWEDGICNTYCVEIDKINLNQVTRIEAAAMLEYHKFSMPPLTFITLINCTVAPDRVANPSMNDTINFFSECEKYASYVGLPPINLSDSSGKSTQEQFSGTIKRMTMANERMAEIVTIQDWEARNPVGNNDSQANNAGKIFKFREYAPNEALNQQSEVWDDIFDERDERAVKFRSMYTTFADI